MIIGTAGHIDHGKTALVKALTGVDADRLAEEKARGITVELGFAYADLGAGRVTGFVDVPGHERLIRTMVAGAGGIDFALLVVAADDGVMPQTLEHVAILNLLGISRGLVAMTKADLADPARREAVERQIRQALSRSALAEAPILPVSALTGEGVEALRQHLAMAELQTPPRRTDGPFRLAVDRSFTLAGAGTVVTGMVLQGRVAVGDAVVISPSGLVARVRGIHAQNRKAELGRAGQRCALNLVGEGVTKEAVSRGDVVLAPSLHAPTMRCDAVFTLLPGEEKPLKTWTPVHLHSQTEEVAARILPLGGPIAPGEGGLVHLVTERPIAATVGDRFILRDSSATRSLGGGQFIDLRPPPRKRAAPERLAVLAAAREMDPAAALSGLLALAPVEIAAFRRDRALEEGAVVELCAALRAEVIEGVALSPAHVAALESGMAAELARFHEENPDLVGIGRERLRLSLRPRLEKAPFLAFLHREAAAGRIVLEGAFLRLPGHEVRLSEADEALIARIWPELLGEGRFRPPRVRDFAHALAVEEPEVRRVLRLTQRLGRSDQIAHDHFFAREVTREMVEILKDVAAGTPEGWFTAAAFRDRVMNGRKVAIQILDFFDRHRLTLRRGDLRRLNPARLDLFDPAG